MSRLLFLFCFAVLSTASPVAPYAKRAAQQSEEDEGRTVFPQSAHHTEAFNVVHVIAAVFGIVGAAAVTVIAFIMCRRRRRQQQQRNSAITSTTMEQASVSRRPISSSSANNSSTTPTATTLQPLSHQHQLQPVKSISTFDQFASAYCHDERQGTNSTLPHNNNDTPFIPLPSPPPPPYRP